MMRLNCKATCTNDANYSCHVKATELIFNQSYGVHIIPHHATFNSLENGHTIYIELSLTKAILKNRVFWSARAWFKNHVTQHD